MTYFFKYLINIQEFETSKMPTYPFGNINFQPKIENNDFQGDKVCLAEKVGWVHLSNVSRDTFIPDEDYNC